MRPPCLCDALGNCVTLDEVEDFGVDRTAPTILSAIPVENSGDTTADSINPGFVFVNAQDERSGLDGTPVRAYGQSQSVADIDCILDPNGATGGCDDPATKAVVYPVPSGADDQGYQTHTLYVVDRAGNRSAVRNVFLLRDLAGLGEPVVEDPSFSVSAVAGTATTFTSSIDENVDLNRYTFGFTFTAGAFGAESDAYETLPMIPTQHGQHLRASARGRPGRQRQHDAGRHAGRAFRGEQRE